MTFVVSVKGALQRPLQLLSTVPCFTHGKLYLLVLNSFSMRSGQEVQVGSLGGRTAGGHSPETCQVGA